MAYVKVADRKNTAQTIEFIGGMFMGLILFLSLMLFIDKAKDAMGIEPYVYEIYEDFQLNEDRIPSGMKKGYEDWLAHIKTEELELKVEKLEKEIKEGLK